MLFLMNKKGGNCDFFSLILFTFQLTDRHGRDRMVVGFTTTYAISAYHL